jgi:hypothetical protein
MDDFTPDARWTRKLPGGLILRATERPDSPLLESFFAGYDRAFILPDEREELPGFRACLAINPQSRRRFGRFHRELVVVIEEEASGTLLGGANFLATRIDDTPAGHPPVAVALNYLFIEAAARGKGLSRLLKAAVSELAAAAVEAPAGALPPALFIEQNDPLRLSPAAYAEDTRRAGIDQIDRMAIWAKLGAQLVDFPYVQPALSAGQASDDSLAYAVLDFPGESIDPAWFAAHLESFFGISVLKGGDPLADPVAGPQLARLRALAPGETVPLLSMRAAIEALRILPELPRNLPFRDFARETAENFEAKDGTLYWTLSFYVPYLRLHGGQAAAAGELADLPLAFEPEPTLKALDAAPNEATRVVRDAIEPLFNDIADRTRQGQVLDRLLVDGSRRTVAFELPEAITWKTEGRRFRVDIPEEDRHREAEVRRYWYLHSNGAMSWHVAFAVRYLDQFEAEIAAGRVSTLYFLSLLQKLAWPKECDTTGLARDEHGKLSIDDLLQVDIAAGSARRPFWQQLASWFEDDRAILGPVHDHAAGLAFAQVFPPGACIEVPDLDLFETRSLFFIQDEAFFRLIQPKSPKGRLVARRERVLDDAFQRYPRLIKALRRDPSGVYRLDRTFWQDLLQQDPDPELPSEPAADELPPPDPRERLLYLFLAGFNQNIIDWANQEASEVLDSLDPIYPKSDEQTEEGFFIRYANPRSLITYVSRSRTLEVGNDHILTCPYAFLIHLLALQNEQLTREKERRAFTVIDWVRSQLRHRDVAEMTGRARDILANVEMKINRLRIDSFDHFDRHRYANPFRYDTERDVFEELEKLRGTSRLEEAYKEALSALEEQAKDTDRQKDRIEEAEGQVAERRLAIFFGVIGLSGVGGLLFNIRDYLANHHWHPGWRPGPLGETLLSVEGGIIAIIIGCIVWFLVWPTIRRLIGYLWGWALRAAGSLRRRLRKRR